jgi:myosin heavy subunit
MLIGGFFKPEGLLPNFLSTLPASESPPEVNEPSTPYQLPAAKIAVEKTRLNEKIQNFSEKWEAIDLSKQNASTDSANQNQQTMVDLNNTEALLETILKAKQQEVEKLSEHAFSRVKAMESRLHEIDDARNEAVKERLVAEEKLSKIIQQIQKHEESRSEEMKKRRLVEEKIHEVIKESEIIKEQAETEIQKAKLNAKMEEEARIAAEKLTEESLDKMVKYDDIIRESEILSEKYAQQSEDLAETKNLLSHAETRYKEGQEQLNAAQKAQHYAEEQFCNLKLEIDTERTALQLKSEHLQQEIQDKTNTMKSIVGKERELRVMLEIKLQKLFKKYLELEKTFRAEHQARQFAEQRAKQALEQASKAVMHVLSVSNGGIS